MTSVKYLKYNIYLVFLTEMYNDSYWNNFESPGNTTSYYLVGYDTT